MATTSSAQELFRDEMVDPDAWGAITVDNDYMATFNYDYSADGIPEAPNSRVGDTVTSGVKLEANISAPDVTDALTLFPLGQYFTGNYQLRFDAWMNYDVEELILGGAEGTTEFLGGGVGFEPCYGDVFDGAQVIATGDGGSPADWRASKSLPTFSVAGADMAGGTSQGSDPYYAEFLPGVLPPPEQGQLDLAGASGSPGFRWITWQFTAVNKGADNLVDVHIEKPNGERLLIVQIDCNDTSDGSSGCASEGNISLSYADLFPSVSPRPDWTFGIIDNVEVARLGTWINSSGGNWSNLLNWDAGVVPDGPEETAHFGGAIVAPATVTVDIDAMVSQINFDNSNHSYTLTDDGSHTLTLVGAAQVNVIAGSHSIAATLAGANDLAKTGPGTLVLTAANTYTGTTTVADGRLLVNGTHTGGGGYTVGPLGTLGGSGTIQAPVSNGGRVAPGNSPGIITIDGDYTQTSAGLLEIEIGGLTPGTEHDQLIVTGTASLGGQLVVEFLDGLDPTPGDEIQFLSASVIEGDFGLRSFQNRAALPQDLAVEFIYEDSLLTGRLQFVTAVVNTLTTAAADSNFMDGAGFDNGAQRGSYRVLVKTTSGSPTTVRAEANPMIPNSASPFVDSLTLEGQGSAAPLKFVHDASADVSSAIEVNVKAFSNYEFHGGTLVTPQVNVEIDGMVSGSGLMLADLIVGMDALGGAEAILSPGLAEAPHGVLGIEGDLQQGPAGALRVDISGADEGQFDTINVSGTATFGGALRIDATNLTPLAPGTTFEILTAGDVTADAFFDDVETVGNDEIFFAPIYPAASGNGQFAGGGSVTPDASLLVGQYYKGDMDRDGIYDDEDVQAFALALSRPLAYRSLYGIFGHQSGDLDGFGTGSYQPNGKLDFDDIDEFALLMSTGTGASAESIRAAIERQLAVPEPGTATLLLSSSLLLVTCCRRRRLCVFSHHADRSIRKFQRWGETLDFFCEMAQNQ